MAIAELLGSIPLAHFYEQYFLKLPFALAGGCSHLLPLATRETLLEILSQPDADIIAASAATAQHCSPPIDAAQLDTILTTGASVGVRHAQRQNAALANLAEDFARDCNAVVDIHLYLTPARCPGFGWHYDAEDVFILQTCGAKVWELRKNTVNPWPVAETLPEDMRYEKEIMPILSCNLAAGDWLYIPAGYWHRTRAGSDSISLSVGLATRSGIDVLDFFRQQLRESLRWRQRVLPVIASDNAATSEAALAMHLAELAQDFAAVLTAPSAAAEFLEFCRASSRRST